LLTVLCRFTIHIGVTLIGLSFIGMGITIFNSNEDAIFDYQSELDIERKEYYIKHNPLFYAMDKMEYFNDKKEFKE